MNRKSTYGWFAGLILVWSLVALAPGPVLGADNSDLPSLQERVDGELKLGHFRSAISLLEELLELEAGSGPARQADILVQLAEACQRLGNNRQALSFLQQAQPKAEALGDLHRQGLILGSLAKLNYQIGERQEARSNFLTALELIDKEVHPGPAAAMRNNFANLEVVEGNFDKALKLYNEVIELASKAGDPQLLVSARINMAKTYVEMEQPSEVLSLLNQAFQETVSLDDSHEKSFNLITIGRLAYLLPDKGGKDSDGSLFSYTALKQGLDIADRLQDKICQTYGLIYLGNLYEDGRRYDEALYLTSKGVFVAQEIRAMEIVYQGQWQLGRILNAQGERNMAIDAYRQAINSIQTIRDDLVIDCEKGAKLSYRETVGPIYFELADLLLQQSLSMTDSKKREPLLLEVRFILEQLKTVELQDYFQDSCVTTLQGRVSALDRVVGNTAVIYPVLLEGRLELLVSYASGMKQYRVDVAKDVLTEEVRRFRHKLQVPGSRFQRHAKKLYNWLIAPMEKDLVEEAVTTLVFVPDGALRTIPMGALHDGEDFLISKYAVSVTPGLTLTDPSPLSQTRVKILLNGLSQPVQGFSGLPSVLPEIAAISEMFDSKLFLDKDYTFNAVEGALEGTPFSIIHIASHGQFSSDPRQSFLLTHDGKLTMDNLESLMGLSAYRENPVELLTLSACQTAVGDDRAALGLAGVAIKSGARAALASLWFINDQATSELVQDFYRHLKESPVSKAEALRLAQVRLLSMEEYSHPAFWAPFLLIGNWL